MLDPDDTRQEDLRAGHAPWHRGLDLRRGQLAEDRRCDVLVVGGGITGALVAQHLVGRGHDVCVIDREEPGLGSTAASTAMLLWEIDQPLAKLAEIYGFERAAGIYRHSLAAVAGLRGLVERLALQVGFRSRNSLYLSSDTTHAADLLAEHGLRRRAGLPGHFLDYRTLQHTFGFDREAAILSAGAADADPLMLARAVLHDAVRRGAILLNAEAKSYDSSRSGAVVGMANGHVIEAGHVVLATGYVLPAIVNAPLHRAGSTWAIATGQQSAQNLWPDGVLVWEARENYLYARTTVDRRIVIGGEDEADITEPDQRDALTVAKARALQSRLAQLVPSADASRAFAWSGTFGRTADGLPLIGPVPGHPRILAAYGYGGNGITFSYLASRMIGRLVKGDRQPWFDDFAIDRTLPNIAT